MMITLKIDFSSHTKQFMFVNEKNQTIYRGVKKKGLNSYIDFLLVSEGKTINIFRKIKWFSKSFYFELIKEPELATIKSSRGFKINYVGFYKNENYFFYGHKGLLTSIFLDSSQIGYIEEVNKSFKGVKEFKIFLNDDCNLALICCFISVFTFETTSFDSIDSKDINYSLGNVGPEEFPFDKNWKPKSFGGNG